MCEIFPKDIVKIYVQNFPYPAPKVGLQILFPNVGRVLVLTLGIFPWFVPLALPYPARLVACACPWTKAVDRLGPPPGVLHTSFCNATAGST